MELRKLKGEKINKKYDELIKSENGPKTARSVRKGNARPQWEELVEKVRFESEVEEKSDV